MSTRASSPAVLAPSAVPLLALLALLAASSVSGCVAEDDDGGSSSDTSQDEVRRDVGPEPDTGGAPDAGADTSVQPDQSAPDAAETSPPDAVQPPCGGLDQACCAGSTCDYELRCALGVCTPPSSCPGVPACLEPPLGSPDVPIAMRSGEPPVLGGGTVRSAAFELDLIEIYADYTFSQLVDSVAITSSGNSYGSLEFRGADWGFEANLDLYLDIMALGMDFGQPFAQLLYAGGCYTIAGSELESDLTECGATWPEGTTPPNSLAFESTQTGMRFLLILTRETLVASSPPSEQWAANLAIVDDLPVIFTFSRAD
jgi:hypothetical protein